MLTSFSVPTEQGKQEESAKQQPGKSIGGRNTKKKTSDPLSSQPESGVLASEHVGDVFVDEILSKAKQKTKKKTSYSMERASLISRISSLEESVYQGKNDDQRSVGHFSKMSRDMSTTLDDSTWSHEVEEGLAPTVVKIMHKEEDKEKLAESSFSFLVASKCKSWPFVAGLATWALKVIMLVMILIDIFTGDGQPLKEKIPDMVTTTVFIAQLISYALIGFTTSDLLSGLEMMFYGHDEAINNAFKIVGGGKKWQWWLSCAFSLSNGMVILMASFLLVCLSETAFDVFLNFAAVAFISELDEAVFLLSKQGFLGKPLKNAAQIISDTKYERKHNNQQDVEEGSCGSRGRCSPSHVKPRHLRLFLFWFVTLATVISGFAIFALQNNGSFASTYLFVQFGDNVNPELSLHSGFYKLEKQSKDTCKGCTRGLAYVEQTKEASTQARIAYCRGTTKWALILEETGRDPCDQSKILATSGKTESLSILASKDSTWNAKLSSTSETFYPLELFTLAKGCEDDSDCNGNGKCKKNKCECNGFFFGARCQFQVNETCNRIALDRSVADSFPVAKRVIQSNAFELALKNRAEAVNFTKNNIIQMYERPIYHSTKNNSRDRDVIFFTGNRWALADLGMALNETSYGYDYGNATLLQKALERLSNTHARNILDVDFVTEEIAFLSSQDKQSSPIGHTWLKVDGFQSKSSSLARVEDLSEMANGVQLLCATCKENDDCRFDGICGEKEEGKCLCFHGASGEICELPPTGNGRCNQYFNDELYNFDGGDCCQTTCKGEDCGISSDLGVFTGFPACAADQSTSSQTCINENNDEFCYLADSELDANVLSDPLITISSNGNFLAVTGNDDGVIRTLQKSSTSGKWLEFGKPITLSSGELVESLQLASLPSEISGKIGDTKLPGAMVYSSQSELKVLYATSFNKEWQSVGDAIFVEGGKRAIVKEAAAYNIESEDPRIAVLYDLQETKQETAPPADSPEVSPAYSSFTLSPAYSPPAVAPASQRDLFASPSYISPAYSPTYGGFNSFDYENAEGCFDEFLQPVPACECHPTCKACGFYDLPDEADDCISCKDRDQYVEIVYSDGTGYCRQQSPTNPSPSPATPTPPSTTSKGDFRLVIYQKEDAAACSFNFKESAPERTLVHASISGNVQFMSIIDTFNNIEMYSFDLFWENPTAPDCGINYRSYASNNDILRGFEILDMKLSWIGDRITVLGRKRDDDSIHVFTSSVHLLPVPEDLIPFPRTGQEESFVLEELGSPIRLPGESLKYVGATLSNEGTTVLITYEENGSKKQTTHVYSVSKIFPKGNEESTHLHMKLGLEPRGDFKHSTTRAGSLSSIAISENARSLTFIDQPNKKNSQPSLIFAETVSVCKKDEISLHFTEILNDVTAVDTLSVYTVKKMRDDFEVIDQVFMHSEVKGNSLSCTLADARHGIVSREACIEDNENALNCLRFHSHSNLVDDDGLIRSSLQLDLVPGKANSTLSAKERRKKDLLQFRKAVCPIKVEPESCPEGQALFEIVLPAYKDHTIPTQLCGGRTSFPEWIVTDSSGNKELASPDYSMMPTNALLGKQMCLPKSQCYTLSFPQTFASNIKVAGRNGIENLPLEEWACEVADFQKENGNTEKAKRDGGNDWTTCKSWKAGLFGENQNFFRFSSSPRESANNGKFSVWWNDEVVTMDGTLHQSTEVTFKFGNCPAENSPSIFGVSQQGQN